MLILKNERGLSVARVEFVSEIRRVEENRAIIQWLRHCPVPSVVRMHVDGEPVGVSDLRAGHLDFLRSQVIFDSDEVIKKKERNQS